MALKIWGFAALLALVVAIVLALMWVNKLIKRRKIPLITLEEALRLAIAEPLRIEPPIRYIDDRSLMTKSRRGPLLCVYQRAALEDHCREELNLEIEGYRGQINVTFANDILVGWTLGLPPENAIHNGWHISTSPEEREMLMKLLSQFRNTAPPQKRAIG